MLRLDTHHYIMHTFAPKNNINNVYIITMVIWPLEQVWICPQDIEEITALTVCVKRGHHKEF